MKDVLIRYAVVEDYENAQEIMQQVQALHVKWRPDIYKQTFTVLPHEEYKRAVDQNTIIVAESNEKVVGMLSYICRHVESDKQVTRDIIFIDCMAVDKENRGNGIGHKLIEFVKNIVKEKSFDGLELQVNAKNTDARKMYEKYGFVEKSINMEYLLQ
ncbi:GNAT family N-acetyltransferase [Clostridium felsineum]|uniref:GNAT family N-acetyltransferase n=1 Tax=Clostridium felsineum TaxID=36839 RepID=UPI00098C2684|nr:GNAT family N-acetyltransferase [Clostridium felsineum]URZ18605.1 hypothetical protein CLFE_046930 [Clostridium felsineum DSM 794]